MSKSLHRRVAVNSLIFGPYLCLQTSFDGGITWLTTDTLVGRSQSKAHTELIRRINALSDLEKVLMGFNIEPGKIKKAKRDYKSKYYNADGKWGGR